MAKREDTWKRLGSETFDLLIIGGGITGAGALRDAVRRGLKVAMVEMHDFAYGTSSRSSKLIHGGLRYLEQYEFSLVFEAVSERRILQNIAPHLVNPLGFLFPIYKESRVSVNTLRAGLWLYDGLSLFRSPKMHKTLSRKQATEQEPLLNSQGLQGAPLYYDCATDDARLTLETILDAVEQGAAVANYARVTGFIKDSTGRIDGARVEDVLRPGVALEVKASAVVNATGPWTDRVRSLGVGTDRLLSPTKGVHIVVPAFRLPLRHAVVCNHPRDKRVLFAIPWGDQSYIGTTDTFYDGPPEEVAADMADIDYLLEAANWYFPLAKLGHPDVTATWAGLRPLIRQDGNSASNVSREHEIRVDPDGLLTIAGGKLTTYRRMGAEVVSRALDLIALTGKVPTTVHDAATGREPLPGAVGWPEDDDRERVAARVQEAAQAELPPGTALHLADRYGMRGIDIARLCAKNQLLRQELVKGRPEILALVDWAVTRELAETVADLMIRRTQLFFRDADQGLGAVEVVADRMAELLGWDEARKLDEILHYRKEVSLSRRWREG